MISAPFVYLPAWAYRFILKSTLWFWWILFIVGGAPRLDGGIEGLRADVYRKASAWIGIATALFAVVSFCFGWGRGMAPLFLLMNRRRARPDSTPKMAYTYLA